MTEDRLKMLGSPTTNGNGPVFSNFCWCFGGRYVKTPAAVGSDTRQTVLVCELGGESYFPISDFFTSIFVNMDLKKRKKLGDEGTASMPSSRWTVDGHAGLGCDAMPRTRCDVFCMMAAMAFFEKTKYSHCMSITTTMRLIISKKYLLFISLLLDMRFFIFQ